ncbi:MAG: DUF2007 domain-containing protein [Ignavibacteria bacterium]|nr:DUF2007 domain-containing protein [Ignavibacteria bacterium]
MQEEFVEIFTTYDPIEAEIVITKLKDEEIEFTVKGTTQLSVTMETFNTPLTRMALKQPIKIFVKENDAEKAKKSVTTDQSDLLRDDLEY